MANPYLTISGPIGAGKSTLAAALSKYRGYPCFLESAGETNPFLEDFYRNRKEFAFRSQCFFLVEALRQQQEIALLQGGAIQDRCLGEHMGIFIAGSHERGELSKEEFELLDNLAGSASSHLPSPDLMIYLKGTPEILEERINSRGREYEQQIGLDALNEMVLDYDSWIDFWRRSPVLELNISEYDARVDADLAQISQKIDHLVDSD